jgi:hypothetical protein
MLIFCFRSMALFNGEFLSCKSNKEIPVQWTRNPLCSNDYHTNNIYVAHKDYSKTEKSLWNILLYSLWAGKVPYFALVIMMQSLLLGVYFEMKTTAARFFCRKHVTVNFHVRYFSVLFPPSSPVVVLWNRRLIRSRGADSSRENCDGAPSGLSPHSISVARDVTLPYGVMAGGRIESLKEWIP